MDDLFTNRKKYMKGDRVGRLVVETELSKEESRNPKYVDVFCHCDCGKGLFVRKQNLQSGNSLSCGCLERDYQRTVAVANIIGKRFGRLVALEEADDSYKKIRILCICDCGNYKSVAASDLRSGMTKSCGCLKRETSSSRTFEDLTGQTFHELTAIRRVEDFVDKKGNHRVQWLWRCSCGREIKALPINVKRGMTKSCGHIGQSYAEYQICNLLSENNIEFKYDYAPFNDLVNPGTGYTLPVDFFITRSDGLNLIIEHQGIQHYKAVQGKDYFGKLEREVTDKIKKEYFDKNNILFYETRYDKDYIEHTRSILRENNLM